MCISALVLYEGPAILGAWQQILEGRGIGLVTVEQLSWGGGPRFNLRVELEAEKLRIKMVDNMHAGGWPICRSRPSCLIKQSNKDV